jgi:hypothetical protein
VKRQIDECDDDVGLGCRRVSWEGEEEEEEEGGVQAMSETIPHENKLYLTRIETRRPGLASF